MVVLGVFAFWTLNKASLQGAFLICRTRRLTVDLMIMEICRAAQIKRRAERQS